VRDKKVVLLSQKTSQRSRGSAWRNQVTTVLLER
jgi:hypothetical protein